MSVSVGDFAEQLIAQENRSGAGGNNSPTFEADPSFYSPDTAKQAPDISDVKVPDEFVTSIIEDKKIIAEQPVTVKQAIMEDSPAPSTSVTEVSELKSLVLEVKSLLMELKQTLTEMTTVGAGIGAPAAPKKDNTEDDLKKLLRKIKTKRGTSK